MTLKNDYVKLESKKGHNINKKTIMENFLIDQEILGNFVDELISKSNNKNVDKEAKIRELDQKIGEEIFGSLDANQLDEFNRFLDMGDTDEAEEEIRNFFAKYNINLDLKIQEIMEHFAKDFLEGNNNE